MRNIDWGAGQARYEDGTKVAPPRPLVQTEFADVPSITVEELQAMLASSTPVQIIDTRPKHYSTKSREIAAWAVWRAPERGDDWIDQPPTTPPSVTSPLLHFPTT